MDFFPPICDDPYIFGQIAAANAMSDIYAMGGQPKLALNIMAVPTSMNKEHVHAILKGGYEKVYEAGALITGGHSIYDKEPKYGLSVTGFVHPDKIITNSGAKEGDVLILTKPIGIGIITTAAKAEMVSEEGLKFAYRLMSTLNKSARDIMVKYNVHACTDVTGFGLMGHLLEMAQGSDKAAVVDTENIDFINEAKSLAQSGILPEGLYRNRSYAEGFVEPGIIKLSVQDMLFDPQTSGGLLIAGSPEDADMLFNELKGRVPSAQRIGHIENYKGGARIILR